MPFRGEDLDDADARERLYTLVTASAAFPGLYTPITVPDLGACLDGGAVNNTPIVPWELEEYQRILAAARAF